ncbi:hypothetical protein EYF80_062099 [Liparis tanakae]|uniref:Uncharacterized protein n=1 Tax=Liparis tanakae TaxID=230148 RepID=A0A4Z2EH03_9TELE|nr:hypothetical protein EYF80_062099 [Liparis tanakae]
MCQTFDEGFRHRAPHESLSTAPTQRDLQVHHVQRDRGQRTEDRGPRTEDRGQRTEDRGQRTEDRG